MAAIPPTSTPRRIDRAGQPDSFAADLRYAAAALRAAVPTLLVGGLVGVVLFMFWEGQTFGSQAQQFAAVARSATYDVRPGPSRLLRFPAAGPYDKRLGYTDVPRFTARLEARGYEVERQARFSRELATLTDWGLYPIYDEKPRAGLNILGRTGEPIFSAQYPGTIFENFEAIPDLMVESLLFVEDRNLLGPGYPNRNPAIDWSRLVRSAFAYGADRIGFHQPVPGGSTLATQIEKYRHSPGGLTESLGDKVRQMATASLRAYRGGGDTSQIRRRIVVDYMNGVSLGAIRGYGEVIGIPAALGLWHGVDYEVLDRVLAWPAPGSVDVGPQARGKAFKQALSLLLSGKRPGLYLMQRPDLLNARADVYLGLLADEGIISAEMRDHARAWTLEFDGVAGGKGVPPSVGIRAASGVRNAVAGMLGVNNLYDLHRFDLTVESTLDKRAGDAVADTLSDLATPEGVNQAGLNGRRMLAKGDPSKVVYSITLYERGEDANMLRVHVDTLDQPMDVGNGMKLDLGSTAKLRALISYLEAVSSIYESYRDFSPGELRNMRVDPMDALADWTVERLRENPGIGLAELLDNAMEREYSADPGEDFFTGGGIHRFRNFSSRDNSKTVSVTDALKNSTNLVFIRLMRDVVNHEAFGVSGAPGSSVLTDRDDPRRAEYLRRFALVEGKQYLRRFYSVYTAVDSDAALRRLVSRVDSKGSVPTAAAIRAVRPGASLAAFSDVMRNSGSAGDVTATQMRELYEDASPSRLDLDDSAYLSGIHPLELWLVGFLHEYPGAGLRETLDASEGVRLQSYAWLMRSKRVRAQNQRIRQVLEADAFRRIHEDWKRHGYPFESLVPSLATAIGSSADRPSALAELMGILVNDGIRKPTRRVERLRFAENTPYETVFAHRLPRDVRVMPVEVARTVKRALQLTVEEGTARRAHAAFGTRGDNGPVIGGKTGTGDHKFMVRNAEGNLVAKHVVSRAATFMFYIGDRYYGVVTAYVEGQEAGEYDFTSTLATQVFAILAPHLDAGLGVTEKLEIAGPQVPVGYQRSATREVVEPQRRS